MENRKLLIEDYFKLRIMLNRTNFVRDQKTDVDFIVLTTGKSNYSIAATLTGIKNPKYLEICKKGFQANWKPADYSGLIYFEDFCIKFLRRNLTQNFSLEELKKAAIKFKIELQGLGIPRQ